MTYHEYKGQPEYDSMGNRINPYGANVYPSRVILEPSELPAIVTDAYSAIEAADIAKAKSQLPASYPGKMWYIPSDKVWFIEDKGNFKYEDLEPDARAFADWIKRRGLLMAYTLY